MMLPDLHRLSHIRDSYIEIQKAIDRYGTSFDTFNSDPEYQRSVAFSILQIGELSGGLSQEFRQSTANRVQWGPMKEMRNLVAHNYSGSCNQISCRC